MTAQKWVDLSLVLVPRNQMHSSKNRCVAQTQKQNILIPKEKTNTL